MTDLHFLTTITGEPYQPVRLAFHISNYENLLNSLQDLDCVVSVPHQQCWLWQHTGEMVDVPLPGESKDNAHLTSPIAWGTISLTENSLLINVDSIQKALIALLFFENYLNEKTVTLQHIDFTNVLRAHTEKAYQNFDELFNNSKLQAHLDCKQKKFLQIKNNTKEDNALAIEKLINIAYAESLKPLPDTERCPIDNVHANKLEKQLNLLIAITILMTRQIYAIEHWHNPTCTLQDILTKINLISKLNLSNIESLIQKNH